MELLTIDDTDFLLRRVPFTDPRYIKDDGTISSFAFKPRKGEDGLSVDIERLTAYEASILNRGKFRLYRLEARIPRQLGLECVHDPQPGNDAHALIKGTFTSSISRQLARQATRVSEPC